MKDIVSSNGYPDDKQIERMIAEYSQPLTEDERRKRQTLKMRLELLELRERKNAELNSWKLDSDAFDERFPLTALPESVQAILKDMRAKFGAPYGATLAAMLTTSSGHLGLHKAKIVLNPLDPEEFINPAINSIHIGGSSNSKSEVSRFTLAPIRSINSELLEQQNVARTQKRAIQKKLDQLYSMANQDKNKIQEMELKLLILENGGASYVTDYVSIPALAAQIFTNSLQSQLDGQTQPGLLLAKQDASAILDSGTSPKDVKYTNEEFSKFNNLLDGVIDIATPATRKTQGKISKNGIAAYLEMQPTSMTCLSPLKLRGNGFLNRFIYVYYPEIESKLEKRLDLRKSRACWKGIFRYVHDFNEGAFYCDKCDKLEEYIDTLDELATKASKNNDLPQYAFCKKLFFVVHQIALQLHLWNLALNNDPLNDSLTVDLDGLAVPSWTVIPAETIRNAIQLCEYYRKTRDIVWGIVLDAVSPQIAPRRNDEVPIVDATEKPMPLKVDALYRYIFETNDVEKFDLLEPGDGRGRVISVSDLRNRKSYYKNVTTRAIFENELTARCLMYRLESVAKRSDGKLVFIPDDLTAEELRLWRDSLTDDENDADAA